MGVVVDDKELLERLFDRVTKIGDDMSYIKSDVRSVREQLDRFGSDVDSINERVNALEKQRSHIAANVTSSLSMLVAIGAPIVLWVITGGGGLCGIAGSSIHLRGGGLFG